MPRTLLLADANTAIQRIVALMFATEDMRVIGVSDGEHAIARIADERPDIVLADVAMPRRNGYEVAAFVKGRPELAHIPVLLLAGALEPVDQALAAASRCDGVLVKPFEPQQVIARVRELMGGTHGAPAHMVPGVPRPIDRVVETRRAPAPASAASTAAAERREEPPLRMVQRPQAVQSDAPVPPGPPPAAAPGAKDDELADYFDQLDAAFDHIDAGAGRPDLRHVASASEEESTRIDVPTLSSVLGRPAPPSSKEPIPFAPPAVESPDIRPVPPPPRDGPIFRTVEPAPAQAPLAPDTHRRVTADPFAALIAADEEERQATRVAAEPAPSELLIEAVAARVIERLAPEGIDHLVSRIVSDVAERLVGEEIDRIRGRK